MNDKPISDRQKELIKSLVSQAVAKKRYPKEIPEPVTSEEANEYIKYLLNLVNGTTQHTKKVSEPVYARKISISDDQVARTYSNIISTCWQSNKTLKDNLDTIHTVFADFKKVINDEHK